MKTADIQSNGSSTKLVCTRYNLDTNTLDTIPIQIHSIQFLTSQSSHGLYVSH